MTVIDVDTDVYKEASRALIAAADSFYLGVDRHWTKLAETGSNMCGSYQEAVDWATGYNGKANDLLTQVRTLAENVNGYGNILAELAWLHALGDHNANMKPIFCLAQTSFQPPRSWLLLVRAYLKLSGKQGWNHPTPKLRFPNPSKRKLFPFFNRVPPLCCKHCALTPVMQACRFAGHICTAPNSRGAGLPESQPASGRNDCGRICKLATVHVISDHQNAPQAVGGPRPGGNCCPRDTTDTRGILRAE